MSIVKVIEVISEGDSIESAMEAAVAEAAKTLDNVKQINVVNIEGVVEKNTIKKFRVNSKISFVLNRK